MNNTALRLVSASAVYFISILLTVPAHALPPGSGSLYFVHNNASGTPQALTDEAGDVVWTAQTDPFGAAEVDEDPDRNGQNIEFNVRAPGQYHDGETGLHYNYFRYYDPGAGRYVTSDPIGLLGGINTYTYAENSPVRYIDPFGLDSFEGMIHGLTGMRTDQLPIGTPGQLDLLDRQNLEDLDSQCKRCRAGCFTGFFNPIPGFAIEKSAQLAGRQFSDVAGLIAKDAARKINKGIAAVQLADCLDDCKGSCNARCER